MNLARPAFIWLLALIAAVLQGCAAAPQTNPVSPPPNIILILADDLGYGELGSYGQQKIHTPHLDALAREGIRFTQYYAGSPVCAPSRCTLLTGLHTGHSFVRDNRELKTEGQLPLPPATQTLPLLLRDAGYATGMTGKWGLGGPDSTGEPLNQGFDYFFGYLCQREAHNYYPTHLWRNRTRVDLEGNTPGNLVGKQYSHDLIAEEALSYIRRNSNKRFFLYVPFTIPHVSLQVPDDSLREYVGRLEDVPYDGKQSYLPHPTPHAAYAAMITRMDRDIGRIMDLLSELHLSDNTLVIFTSDNGPTYDRVGGADSDFFQSSGTLRGRKGSVYEGGLRVPFIARYPGVIPKGAVTDHIAAAYDIMPTLLECAQARQPASLDGISFFKTLQGDDGQRAHEHLYWEFPSYGGQAALRLGNYKLVRRNLFQPTPDIALYDLASDPSESVDIARRQPEVVARMLGMMQYAHTNSPAFPFAALDH